MEAYPNNTTGRYFIYVEDTGLNKMLLVAPTCKVEALKSDLFGEPVSGEEGCLVLEGIITAEQLEAYKAYHRDRHDEEVDRWKLIIEEMPPWQRERLIEILKNELANGNDAAKEAIDADH